MTSFLFRDAFLVTKSWDHQLKSWWSFSYKVLDLPIIKRVHYIVSPAVERDCTEPSPCSPSPMMSSLCVSVILDGWSMAYQPVQQTDTHISFFGKEARSLRGRVMGQQKGVEEDI